MKMYLGVFAAAAIPAVHSAAVSPSEAVGSTLKLQVESTLLFAKGLQQHLQARRLQDVPIDEVDFEEGGESPFPFPFDPSELPLDDIDPALLEGLDLYEIVCRSGLIPDLNCRDLEGIVLEQIPDGACDDDKDRVCAVTADIASIVQDRTCQQAIGLDIPRELQDIITAGSYCFNTLLCGDRNNAGGSIERCLDQVSGILRNAEELATSIDDEYIADIVAGVDDVFANPIELVPTMCGNNCFNKFTAILRSGYELLENSEDCVAALEDLELGDVGLPIDLPMDMPSMELPSIPVDMEELPAGGDLEEYLLLVESGCTQNAAGDYCLEKFYDLVVDLSDGDEGDEEEPIAAPDGGRRLQSVQCRTLTSYQGIDGQGLLDQGVQECQGISNCIQYEVFGSYVQGCDSARYCSSFSNSGGNGCMYSTDGPDGEEGTTLSIKCFESDPGLFTEAGLEESLSSVSEECQIGGFPGPDDGCESCVSAFIEAGGCQDFDNEDLIPDGCDACGEAAADACNLVDYGDDDAYYGDDDIASQICEPLAELGCCANLILTNPVIVDLIDMFAFGDGPDEGYRCNGHYGDGGGDMEISDPELEWCCDHCNCRDLSDRVDCDESDDSGPTSFSEVRAYVFDTAATCDPPETALLRPCTDGLTTPVAIVSSALTMPADVYIDEETLIDGIATGAGVPPNSVLITEWTNRVQQPARRLLQDEGQVISFEIILRGSSASSSSTIASNIESDDFVGEVAQATSVPTQDIGVAPPMQETVEPSDGNSDDGADTALIVGGVVAALVGVGLIAGLVIVVKTRNSQRQESRMQGVDMPQYSTKNPTNEEF